MVTMTRNAFYIALQDNGRYTPARCCGAVIYYWEPGDEWCNEHRCAVMTRYGDRCPRHATNADECGQLFAKHLREMSG